MKELIKLYVTLEVGDKFFLSPELSREYIIQELQFLAEDFDGSFIDLEIK